MLIKDIYVYYIELEINYSSFHSSNTNYTLTFPICFIFSPQIRETFERKLKS